MAEAFDDYYKHELRLLKDMASRFAADYPALAGQLRGSSADPDVERVLEGVAFLSADIRRKIDDEFPEFLHALVDAVCPHYLQPMPACTVMAFTGKPSLKQALTVPAGTHIDARPVQDTTCRFRTCYPVEVLPLTITAIRRPDLENDRPVSEGVWLRVSFKSQDVAVSSLKMNRLRLFVNGEWGEATDLFQLLTRHLRQIQVSCDNRVSTLPTEALRPMGFRDDEALLPRDTTSLPGYAVLHDYFLFPEKFLFLDLDLAAWRDRGEGTEFHLDLFCEVPPFQLGKLRKDRLVLNATPAVNLFGRDAEPLVLDHHESDMLLRPAGAGGKHVFPVSVGKVEGIPRGGSGRRAYRPVSRFAADQDAGPVYQTSLRPSVLHEGQDMFLSVAFPPTEAVPDKEILKVHMTCSNGSLPLELMPGDIDQPTQDTPELVGFRNLTIPSTPRPPPLGEDRLWYLVSHLSLNYLSITDAEALRKVLSHYAGEESKGRGSANRKRIDGMVGLTVSPDECLYQGRFIRGQHLHLQLRLDHFASPGDAYVMGHVLNHFFASCAPLNSFSQLEIEDANSGERFVWPPMLGTRSLL